MDMCWEERFVQDLADNIPFENILSKVQAKLQWEKSRYFWKDKKVP